MRRWLVAATVALVVLTGCGADDPGGAGRPGSADAVPRPGGPPWKQLTHATDLEGVPTGVRGQPDLSEVDRLARAGTTARDAEQFALAVAHLLLDVRYDVRGEQMIEEIASTQMASDLSAHLITDRNDQQEAGTQRKFDTTLDMWIRSEVIGPVESPTRVNVEIVGNLASVPLQFNDWQRCRYDVVQEHGRWRLIDYRDGPGGLFTATNLTAAERREFLTGPGWRRIPAAE